MSKPDNKTAAEVVTEKKAVATGAQPDSRRRNFLIGAGLGSVGVAAALVSATSPTPTPQATAEPQPDGDKGYRETEHIRRYYGTTRI